MKSTTKQPIPTTAFVRVNRDLIPTLDGVTEVQPSQIVANAVEMIKEAHRSLREAIFGWIADPEDRAADAAIEIWTAVLWRLAGLERDASMHAALKRLEKDGRVEARQIGGVGTLVLRDAK